MRFFKIEVSKVVTVRAETVEEAMVLARRAASSPAHVNRFREDEGAVAIFTKDTVLLKELSE